MPAAKPTCLASTVAVATTVVTVAPARVVSIFRCAGLLSRHWHSDWTAGLLAKTSTRDSKMDKCSLITRRRRRHAGAATGLPEIPQQCCYNTEFSPSVLAWRASVIVFQP